MCFGPHLELWGLAMSLWLVSNVPPLLLLLALIVVIAGGAVLIQKLIRRRFPVLAGEELNDVTRFTFGFVGFVYAFITGFIVSSLWGQISTAQSNATAEGAAAVQMARDLSGFDKGDSDRVRQSLLAYERVAVTEWDQARGKRLVEVDRALAQLNTSYDQVNATTDAQKTRLATSYTNLGSISQARTVRLLTARQDAALPWPLLVVIFLVSALVLGSVIVYSVESPVLRWPMVAVFGVMIASNLFLILEFTYPYIGAVAITSEPLQESISVLSQPSP
jgi:Protein of unknown function (DUF4239)